MKFNLKTLLLATLTFLTFSGCGNQHVDYIQSYYYNEKFRYLLNDKKNDQALANELLSKENLQTYFQLDSNLGIVFNLLEKQSDSEKSFDQALKNIQTQFKDKSEEKSKALFVVHFNRGVYYGGQKKIDQALSDYQKALDIMPTSIEAKTNIELLIQKQKDDQKKDGQGKNDQDQKDKDKKDDKGNPEDKKDDKPNNKPDDKKDDSKPQSDRKQTLKYQPRPFKGEQLSEGDVKKILGELSQQDKKIRSQFDKKEKTESPYEGKNEKDW